MTKTIISEQLTANHAAFIKHILSLNDVAFMTSDNGKWTPGQQMDHIFRSVSPINFAFSLPKILLRLFFGKANRPSKSYEDLVKKYHSKLENGGRATGRFVPKAVPLSQRELLKNKLSKTVEQLTRKIDRLTEAQLDELLLPHPLLGKLTLREMLYFTMYHVKHHSK